MTIRAKFDVYKSAELGYNGKRQEIMKAVPTAAGQGPLNTRYETTGVPIREITLTAVHDDGIAEENRSFATATPSGSILFQLNNPALANEFRPGQSYYVDFTPVEPENK